MLHNHAVVGVFLITCKSFLKHSDYSVLVDDDFQYTTVKTDRPSTNSELGWAKNVSVFIPIIPNTVRMTILHNKAHFEDAKKIQNASNCHKRWTYRGNISK